MPKIDHDQAKQAIKYLRQFDPQTLRPYFTSESFDKIPTKPDEMQIWWGTFSKEYKAFMEDQKAQIKILKAFDETSDEIMKLQRDLGFPQVRFILDPNLSARQNLVECKKERSRWDRRNSNRIRKEDALIDQEIENKKFKEDILEDVLALQSKFILPSTPMHSIETPPNINSSTQTTREKRKFKEETFDAPTQMDTLSPMDEFDPMVNNFYPNMDDIYSRPSQTSNMIPPRQTNPTPSNINPSTTKTNPIKDLANSRNGNTRTRIQVPPSEFERGIEYFIKNHMGHGTLEIKTKPKITEEFRAMSMEESEDDENEEIQIYSGESDEEI